MPAVHRIGDANNAGGAVTSTPQGSFFVNGILAAVDGSIGTAHPPCPTITIHCAGNWTTANGAGSFLVEGIPINREGDADTCGDVRAAGSPDFVVA